MRHLASLFLAASLVIQLGFSPASAQALRVSQTEKPVKKRKVARSSSIGRAGTTGQDSAKKSDSSGSSSSGKNVETKKRSGAVIGWPRQTDKAKSDKTGSEDKPKREVPKDRGKKDDVGSVGSVGQGGQTDGWGGKGKDKGKKDDVGQSGNNGGRGGKGKGKGSKDDTGQSDDRGKGDDGGYEDDDQGGHRPPGSTKPPRPDNPPKGEGGHDRNPPDRGHRWPDVVVTVDPFPHRRPDDKNKYDEEEEYDEPKKDDEKSDKADDIEEPKESKKDTLKSTDPLPSASAPAAPRNLKYDGGTYRRLIDVLLERKQIGAALRVLQLLKDREYLEYTGDFDALVAGNTSANRSGGIMASPTPSLGVRRDWRTAASEAMSSYAADATLVGKKDKKKATSEEDEASASVAGDGSWEGSFESRTDSILTASDELEQLRAIPEADRKKKQQARIAELEAQINGETRDLDALVASLAGDLGKKDGRVKRLRDSDDMMAELSQLGTGVVALYTILTDHRYWVVLVTPTTREAFSRPVEAADLNAKVMDFRTVLRDPKADPLPLAKELYGIVVGPIEKRLQAVGAKILMWSFDGVLRYVPIVALHDGRGYFVERYANAVFTRATLERLKETQAGSWNGIGLGVSKKIGNYQPLPAVADELHGIFREPAGAAEDGVVSGDVVLDDTFTESALESAMTNGNRVLHIASHFQLNPGDARASQLLLGDGTLLTVGEIRKFKGGFKGVDLLTLSACETAASGTAPDGKEVESFGSVAQDRGARSVLASLWPVHDGSTSALMKSFYRVHETQAGVTKAEALRRAQIGLLTGSLKPSGSGPNDRLLVHTSVPKTAKPSFVADPKAPYAHPYYWASFVLIGSWK
jgi:CHAT domain-containing protein